jgi:membrane fusion protein (multidrug efflux system)
MVGKRLRRGAISLVALAACKPGGPPPAAPIPVEVAAVVQRAVPIQAEWIGTTEGAIDAEIRAQVSGYLKTRDYKEGRVVKKDELLFTIDPRPFKAQLDSARGDLGRASAQLQKTRQDVSRFTPLAKTGAVSQRELDDAIQANRAAEAAVQTAKAAVDKAQLDVGFADIRSPIGGVAGVANAQIGDLVGPTDAKPLTSVSQLDPIRVSFPLSEREYIRFQEVINAVASGGQLPEGSGLELFLADGAKYGQTGHVVAADRQVNSMMGTILLKAEFPNPNNQLRPGQYARVRATVEVRQDALLVPQRAVSELQGVQQVAVVGPDNKVEIRVVQAGPVEGNMRVIEKGLSAGETVIVEGVQKVRDGTVVEPKLAEG